MPPERAGARQSEAGASPVAGSGAAVLARRGPAVHGAVGLLAVQYLIQRAVAVPQRREVVDLRRRPRVLRRLLVLGIASADVREETLHLANCARE